MTRRQQIRKAKRLGYVWWRDSDGWWLSHVGNSFRLLNTVPWRTRDEAIGEAVKRAGRKT